MVSTLTLNRISFSSPLLAESFGLFRLTSRAISLLTILSVKNMSIFTELFQCIFGRNRIRISQRVFSSRYLSQVIRVNTMPILTDMVNYIAVFNAAHRHVVSYTVSPATFFTEEKSTIAVLIKRTLPKTTLTIFYPFSIKSSKFLLSNSFHIPIVPCSPLGLKGEIHE